MPAAKAPAKGDPKAKKAQEDTAKTAGKAVAKTVKAKAKTAAAKAPPAKAATKTAARKTAAVPRKPPAGATKPAAKKVAAKKAVKPTAKTAPGRPPKAATRPPLGRAVKDAAHKVAEVKANPRPKKQAPCRQTGKLAACDKANVYNYQKGCRNLACREAHSAYYREYRRGKRAAERVVIEPKGKGKVASKGGTVVGMPRKRATATAAKKTA